MKKISLLTTIILLWANCLQLQREEKDDTGMLLANLLTPTSGNESVVFMEQTDPYTFNGYCLDSFYGIVSADSYYNMHGGVPQADMGVYQASALSAGSCSALGFSGGYLIQDSENLSFMKYECGPQGTHCKTAAIEAVGFTAP